MQLTPGLGVRPCKNISVQVKNTVGGFAGVTDGCGGVVCLVLSVVDTASNSVVSKDVDGIVVFTKSAFTVVSNFKWQIG